MKISGQHRCQNPTKPVPKANVREGLACATCAVRAASSKPSDRGCGIAFGGWSEKVVSMIFESPAGGVSSSNHRNPIPYCPARGPASSSDSCRLATSVNGPACDCCGTDSLRPHHWRQIGGQPSLCSRPRQSSRIGLANSERLRGRADFSMVPSPRCYTGDHSRLGVPRDQLNQHTLYRQNCRWRPEFGQVLMSTCT